MIHRLEINKMNIVLKYPLVLAILAILTVSCKKQINPLTIQFIDVATGEGIEGIQAHYLEANGILIPANPSTIYEVSDKNGQITFSGRNLDEKTVTVTFYDRPYMAVDGDIYCAGTNEIYIYVQQPIEIVNCSKRKTLKINQVNKPLDKKYCMNGYFGEKSCESFSDWTLFSQDSSSIYYQIPSTQSTFRLDVRLNSCEGEVDNSNSTSDTSFNYTLSKNDTTEITLDYANLPR